MSESAESLDRVLNDTDWRILETMADGRRTNAPDLAERLDVDRSYLNTRLPYLATFDFISRVARGLYEIDDRGIAAVEEVGDDA